MRDRPSPTNLPNKVSLGVLNQSAERPAQKAQDELWAEKPVECASRFQILRSQDVLQTQGHVCCFRKKQESQLPTPARC